MEVATKHIISLLSSYKDEGFFLELGFFAKLY